MSIIDTFDLHGKEIIKAKNNISVIENFPKIVIVVFSSGFRRLALDKYNIQEIGSLNAGGIQLTIYQFEYKGVKLGFFNTIPGGAGAAALLEEIIALGAEKILYFGSCGVLDQEIAGGHLFSRTQRAKRKLACTWRLRAGQIPRPLGRTC